ncbi:Hypothetical protein CINCED_3A020931 [Cinara cedri]|uniref:Uncharacterized protein n=1 Tax=Cinara cedri TaxID=506608 RepID=A0A5E4MXC2_9HEMI|nr:Hypothetical protein CINCED_3A020931 [Cinara cedri]
MFKNVMGNISLTVIQCNHEHSICHTPKPLIVYFSETHNYWFWDIVACGHNEQKTEKMLFTILIAISIFLNNENIFNYEHPTPAKKLWKYYFVPSNIKKKGNSVESLCKIHKQEQV